MRAPGQVAAPTWREQHDARPRQLRRRDPSPAARTAMKARRGAGASGLSDVTSDMGAPWSGPAHRSLSRPKRTSASALGRRGRRPPEHVEAMGFWPKPGSRCRHGRTTSARVDPPRAHDARRRGAGAGNERQALLGARFPTWSDPILNCVGLRRRSLRALTTFELAREARDWKRLRKGRRHVAACRPDPRRGLGSGHSSGAGFTPRTRGRLARHVGSAFTCPGLRRLGTRSSRSARRVRAGRAQDRSRLRVPACPSRRWLPHDKPGVGVADGPIESWCM